MALSLLAFSLVYETDQGDVSIIKNMLSWSVFQTLGKLTYTMYLIHLMLIGWWAADNVIPAYYTTWWIVITFIGIWSLTAGIALVLHLFMEIPMNTMVSMWLKRINEKGCRCYVRSRKRREVVVMGGIQLQDNIQNKEYQEWETDTGNDDFKVIQTGTIN